MEIATLVLTVLASAAKVVGNIVEHYKDDPAAAAAALAELQTKLNITEGELTGKLSATDKAVADAFAALKAAVAAKAAEVAAPAP